MTVVRRSVVGRWCVLGVYNDLWRRICVGSRVSRRTHAPLRDYRCFNARFTRLRRKHIIIEAERYESQFPLQRS